jgi:hypothetical protein
MFGRIFLLVIYSLVLFGSCLSAVGRFEVLPKVLSRRFSTQAFLPFPYADVPYEVKRQATFVYEKYYTVLYDEAKENRQKFAIVGVLNPCFFIGIRNACNGRCVVFHKMACSSVDSLIDITKHELQISGNDSGHLRGYIFSNCMPFYANMRVDGNACYERVLIGGKTFRDKHNGKSHAEEMAFIKDKLTAAFFPTNKERLETRIFESKIFLSAALSVFVDSRLDMRSICIAKEKIFAGFFDDEKDFKEEDTLGIRATFLGGLDNAYFGNCEHSYNSLPFVKLTGNVRRLKKGESIPDGTEFLKG